MTTREDLLEALRRLAVEQGPDITLYRFREETGISRNIVYDRWGNWTNLRVAAGLPRRVAIAPVYSEDELLGEFHAAAREIDRYPTLGELARLSDRSWNTFDRRFGRKSTLIDRYRGWLEPQPAETRPVFLTGIEPDCDPCAVPVWGCCAKSSRRRWICHHYGTTAPHPGNRNRAPSHRDGCATSSRNRSIHCWC